MAHFEVVVVEVRPTDEEIRDNPAKAGIPLATLLERTSGEYVWHYSPEAPVREHWRRTATAIADSNLAEIARATTIPVSLEHLRGRDPATTRVKVRFEISYTSARESRDAAVLDGPHLL
ncbi:hypothetical protein Cch01nite_00230 [Cellulomonas chitinilytica]|uniref:Uncharacterized protein n=1 Tax=Cellulomonas chitinilytica TaxID=398759 RepID=A0A919U0M6_9CELL|nr:hypothetical protein [Cellulomonas chitinilytica]GIG19299.1 hypothetical protein Cch01nite_00230 [Cellulomonas chitinilytica]